MKILYNLRRLTNNYVKDQHSEAFRVTSISMSTEIVVFHSQATSKTVGLFRDMTTQG